MKSSWTISVTLNNYKILEFWHLGKNRFTGYSGEMFRNFCLRLADFGKQYHADLLAKYLYRTKGV